MSSPTRPTRPTAGDPSETPLSAVPDAPGPKAGRDEDDRVSRTLFLVVLAALVVFVVAFLVQSRRIGGFQEQVSGLTGQVEGLKGELAGAEARLERFAVEREQIRLSVDTLREDLLALEALVAAGPAPSGAAALAAPEPGELP